MDGGTYHVVPTGDLVGHEEIRDTCVCGPHVEYFPKGVVVVHHALDGRHAGDADWPRRRAHQVADDEALAEEAV